MPGALFLMSFVSVGITFGSFSVRKGVLWWILEASKDDAKKDGSSSTELREF